MNNVSGPASGCISRTLSEIASTCQKAARGVGCPWGLAEEAGHAVRVLESHGLAGVEPLAALLETPRACRCSGLTDKPVCGIAALARFSDAIADFDSACKKMPETVAGPLLLAAPLLHLARLTGAAYRMGVNGYSMICSATGISVDPAGGKPPSVGKVTIHKVQSTADAVPPHWSCRDVSIEAWQKLEALAANTLVPESDTSRAQGAGPGTSDNY